MKIYQIKNRTTLWLIHGILVISLCMICLSALANSQIPRSITNALNARHVAASSASFLVVDLDDNHVLLSHRANKKRLPASTLKTITTFAALDTLGPDFRWQTRIYHTGSIKNNVLYGDLIIVGGGDPKLVLERIESMFSRVRDAGVWHIEGNIVLDNRIFKGVQSSSGGFDGATLRPYNVSPDGLLVNFSAMIYKFYPDSAKKIATVTHEPIVHGMKIPTSVPLSNQGCGNWRSTLRGSFSATRTRFTGKYPASCGEQHWPVAYPKPKQFAPRVFKGMWQAGGGTIKGVSRYGSKPKNAHALLSMPSLPLSKIISDINQFSNNVMTEQVFLSLPIYHDQLPYSDYKIARRWLNTWWKRHFSTEPPFISKASGLCRNCYIRASQLAKVLTTADKHRYAQVFKESLGLAGVSGTIKSFARRKPNSAAIGRAYIKTGTLSNVAGISGYVDSVSGRRLAVVGIINTPNAARGKLVLDELIDWAANQ